MAKQPKVVTDYEAKLLEWGKANIEYNEADAACRKHPLGWPERNNHPDVKRIEAAGKRLDKLRGPMETATEKYAVWLAKQSH